MPVEVTVSLLSKAIFSSPCWNFLVDGFPRNMDNFNGWFDAIGDECDVSFSTCSLSQRRASQRSHAGPFRSLFHVPSKRNAAAAKAQAHPLALIATLRSHARCVAATLVPHLSERVTLVGVQGGDERAS